MSSPEFQTNKCRICLEGNAERDWNQLLTDSLLTYKDCYYKYTQLEYIGGDKFSTSLCRNCSNGLEYIDAFISKAIETDLVLRGKRNINMTIEDDDKVKHEESNFETTVVEETEIKSEILEPQIKNLNESSSEELETAPVENIYIVPEKCAESIYECSTEEFGTGHPDNSCAVPKKCATLLPQTKKSRKGKCRKSARSRKLENSNDQLDIDKSSLNDKKLSTRIEEKICCSICSKVLSSRYRAIKHEQTHVQNRERNTPCDKCGLKFYSKNSLRLHMQTHLENREKTQKCEFCDKAFFNKGALNVHRRIHLGQMVSCSLCAKQFYRQIDLDGHMNSHSAVKISSDVRIKKKYFVTCKECGENVRSTSFKYHMAKHTNEPLFKCSICNKEFFFRKSAINHVKKTHKKTPAETSNFIIANKTNRISHLFLEQHTNVKVINE